MQAYRRLANQRGKKFRIFYDDTAADEEASPSDPDIRAALELSARSASGRAASSAGRVASSGTSTPAPNVDPAVHAFFRTGALDFSHRIAPGFYACFGEFPEVADKGELPALPLLRQCVVLEGREVITVDPGADQGLRTFLDVKIIEAISNEGSMDTTWRLGMVAALVAARLGGAAPDLALAARYSQYSNSMQIGQQSAVLPLGMLTVRPWRPAASTPPPPCCLPCAAQTRNFAEAALEACNACILCARLCPRKQSLLLGSSSALTTTGLSSEDEEAGGAAGIVQHKTRNTAHPSHSHSRHPTQNSQLLNTTPLHISPAPAHVTTFAPRIHSHRTTLCSRAIDLHPVWPCIDPGRKRRWQHDCSGRAYVV